MGEQSNRAAPRAAARRVEDLEVYQMAYQLSLDVYRFSARFPSEERYGVSSQLRRAIVSVPANIAEGFRRESLKDKARFMDIALGSLEESRTFLKLARDLKLTADAPPLKAVDRSARALYSYRRAIVRRIKRNK
jgi:four helix bundle protein